MKNINFIIGGILIVVLVSAGSFYVGIKYQQSKNPRFGNFQNNGARQFQQGTNQGTRPVRGEIISQDNEQSSSSIKSITVKLQDGSSKIVLFSNTTSINKAAQGSKDDLKVGEQVLVLGSENSDGSVTAQNIQLNPLK